MPHQPKSAIETLTKPLGLAMKQRWPRVDKNLSCQCMRMIFLLVISRPIREPQNRRGRERGTPFQKEHTPRELKSGALVYEPSYHAAACEARGGETLSFYACGGAYPQTWCARAWNGLMRRTAVLLELWPERSSWLLSGWTNPLLFVRLCER